MVAKPLKTKHFEVGEDIYLQSGEVCGINRKVVSKNGIVFYMLVAKQGPWYGGALWLTEREMLLNIA